jgi:DNA mismatch endonuclease Vsr
MTVLAQHGCGVDAQKIVRSMFETSVVLTSFDHFRALIQDFMDFRWIKKMSAARFELPGKPDLVFPRLRKVLFVHGCFWHRHPGCALARIPKSRLDFWVPKLTENRRRDLRNIAHLKKAGWKVDVV